MKGHINLRKVHTPQPGDNGGNEPQTWSQHHAGPSQDKKRHHLASGYASHRHRGHVGKTLSHTHRNRSLVLNNIGSLTKGLEASAVAHGEEMAHNTVIEGGQQSHTTTSWISKRDRHMQLINSSVYDKQANLRSKAINQTLQERAFRKDQREKFKIYKHIQNNADNVAMTLSTLQPNTELPVYELNIAGLRFRVSNGGSKLVRLPSALQVHKFFTANYFILS